MENLKKLNFLFKDIKSKLKEKISKFEINYIKSKLKEKISKLEINNINKTSNFYKIFNLGLISTSGLTITWLALLIQKK